MSELRLNVADIRLRSRVNGPRLRSVVWVQGCTIRCPGCFNPHTHPHEVRHLMDPVQLGNRLLDVPDTEGITISGGEPFEQAEACAALASTVRSAGRSVVVFTGYRFDQLSTSTLPAVRAFLNQIDLLIAGPYVQELAWEVVHWRASSNQTVHVLSDRLKGALADHTQEGPVIEVGTDGRQIVFTGFPAGEDRQWLDRLACVRMPNAP